MGSNTSDVNWRSYVGPQDNERTVTSEDWLNPPNPQDYSDLFKCSNVVGLTARGITVVAGSKEDSVDCVRGSGYCFDSCAIQGSTTVKGAIDGLKFYNCVVSGTVELGQYDNYWTLGRTPTTGVLLHTCTSPDGKPIRVKLWDADAPYVVNTNVQIIRIPKWIWLPYFIFRRITNSNAV
jgi:hypothetical protein